MYEPSVTEMFTGFLICALILLYLSWAILFVGSCGSRFFDLVRMPPSRPYSAQRWGNWCLRIGGLALGISLPPFVFLLILSVFSSHSPLDPLIYMIIR